MGSEPNVQPRQAGRPVLTQREDKFYRAAGCLYLALLPLNLRLCGQVFAHDLAGIVFLLALLRARNLHRLLRLPDLLLAVFLVAAAGATASHLSGGRDIYELAIFAYMAVLFLFFRQFAPSGRQLRVIGLATLAVMWLAAGWEILVGARDTYQAYEGATLSFIANRFFFTFDHPNLTGSFYALPVCCVLLADQKTHRERDWRRAVLLIAGLGVLCVPLALTASRHMLLSFGLVLAYAAGRAPRRWRAPWGLSAAFVLLLLLFALFYLTILFPFFPLQRSFPFFNTNTMGMYTIHQTAYLKMVVANPGAFFLGVGPTAVRELYPTVVDSEAAYAILQQYKNESLIGVFTHYMDAHNELLNLAASFGTVAMACCFAFWIAVAAYPRLHTERRDRWMLILYIAGVVLVSFWDDILSKRWIWAGLGILAAHSEQDDAPCTSA